ncbi:hypothetical protein R3P38DRAFT_2628262 [Favolaschia claudopus]|uniref:F-box domain-containing protein n=1 Tax=Favolaschia claudopus TaxID=2862362 RepID=A0AAW0BCL1_9AGAR
MRLFEFGGPPIRDRLRRNILPLDIEIKAIRHSIDGAQARLDALQLDGSLSRSIDSTCVTRTVEIENLSNYIKLYSSLLAPIRRLPVEILRIIFLDPDIHNCQYPQPDPTSMTLPTVAEYKPNVVGAVGYHWHSVVCETATLWSHLMVHLNRGRQYNTLDVLRIALERSQNAPLHLQFHTADTQDLTVWSSLDGNILERILENCERWADIDLALNSELLDRLSPAQGRLRSLHTVTFRDTYHSLYLSPDPPPPSTIFSIAPNLRMLRLIDTSTSTATSESIMPILPLSHLTHLRINSSCLASSELYHFVVQAQNIRDLSFRVQGGGHKFTGLPTPPPVVCNTQKITVYGRSADQYPELNVLKSMVAPDLETLFLVHCKFRNKLILQSFVERSKFNLRQLLIQSTPVRSADLVAILRLLPTVETLTLADLIPNAVTNVLAQSLTIGAEFSADEAVLPNLTALCIDGVYLVEAGPLLAMLQSRVAPPNSTSRLRDLNIIMRNVVVSAARLEEFSPAAKMALKSLRFVCIDEARRNVVIEFGAASLCIGRIRLRRPDITDVFEGEVV